MNEMKQYKKEITKKFKQYDNETLINMLEEGKKNEVVECLLPLVLYVVDKFKMPEVFDEMVSVGNLSLIEAVDKFNVEKSRKFISFCRSYINWSLLDYLNKGDNLIRLPFSKNVSQRTLNSYPKVVYYDDYSKIKLYDEEYEELPPVKRTDIEKLLLTIPKLKYSKIMLFLDYHLIPGITYNELSVKNGYSKQNCSLIILEVLEKINNTPLVKEKLREMLIN
jgi:RNA polymerase sigma factor (sigma-70 family)